MGFGQVGINGHIEPRWTALNPAQYQMLHRIKADSAALQEAVRLSV